jgi:hypothetical protein
MDAPADVTCAGFDDLTGGFRLITGRFLNMEDPVFLMAVFIGCATGLATGVFIVVLPVADMVFFFVARVIFLTGMIFFLLATLFAFEGMFFFFAATIFSGTVVIFLFNDTAFKCFLGEGFDSAFFLSAFLIFFFFAGEIRPDDFIDDLILLLLFILYLRRKAVFWYRKD